MKGNDPKASTGRKERRKGNRSRRGRKGRRTKEMVRIARERMDILMDLSLKVAFAGDLDKAHRYAGLARKIGMRYNVRLRGHHRHMFCRKCNSFLLPSRSQSVRIRHGRRIARCLRCGDIRRVPLDVRPPSLPRARKQRDR